MQVISGSSEGNIADLSRPLIATQSEVRHGHKIAAHSHFRGQLLFSNRGNILVTALTESWYLTPRHALWIPPLFPHNIEATSGISYRSVFIEPSNCGDMPAHPVVVTLSPLVTELVSIASEFQSEYDTDTAEFRLITVLQDQLRTLPPAKLTLPLPKDKRLRKLVDALILNPADYSSREQWGSKVGASGRTLARLFINETGMSYLAWRQRFVVNIAQQLLTEGESVTEIATKLGYSSNSAFTFMFKRVTGTTPQTFLRTLR